MHSNYTTNRKKFAARVNPTFGSSQTNKAHKTPTKAKPSADQENLASNSFRTPLRTKPALPPPTPATPAARRQQVAHIKSKIAYIKSTSATSSSLLDTGSSSSDDVAIDQALEDVRTRLAKLAIKRENRRARDFPTAPNGSQSQLSYRLSSALALNNPVLVRASFESMLDKFAGHAAYWIALAQYEQKHGTQRDVIRLFRMGARCRAEPLDKLSSAFSEYISEIKLDRGEPLADEQVAVKLSFGDDADEKAGETLSLIHI